MTKGSYVSNFINLQSLKWHPRHGKDTTALGYWVTKYAVPLALVSITTVLIKTHSNVSAAKKTKDAQHTSVLFAGTVKLPNLASISPKLLS